MDHKTFSAYTLKTDGQQGIVESIVAVMGNADQGDDVIHNGAFVKSIQERRGKIRVLDQHQTDSIMRAIGKPLEMREIGREQLPPDLLTRYPDATGGLYTKTQYLMDTPEGKGAFQRIAAGAVDEYSIGYDPLDVTYSKRKMPDGSEKTVRDLRTIKLFEYSPVLFGMNDATQTLSAKGATGSSDLPLADRKRSFDDAGSQIENRVRVWASSDGSGDKDKMDWPKYRSAHFWYDASAPELFDSYKLKFTDVIDGKLYAIPRGVFTAAAIMQGSRGGVDIPESDRAGVRSKIAGYYARMRKEFDDDSIVAPWESKAYKDMKPWNVFHEGDKWNVYKVDADGNATGDRLGSFDTEQEARAQVRALYASENAKTLKSVDLTTYMQEVTEAFNEEYGMNDAMMPMGECYCIWRVYDDHLIVCEMMSDDYYSVDYTAVNGEYQFATQDTWVEGSLEFVADTMTGGEMKRRGTKQARPFDVVKVGRIFAQRNMDRLQKIKAEIDALMAEMESADTTDNAPAKARAAVTSDITQAGPTDNTSSTTEALRQSLEIEIETLKLLEV